MALTRRLEPRKEPRQRRAEQTRSRIITAAAHVFADFGYAAGTTNRIAEAAGVSIGSLYQYFPNKDAILAELMTAHVDAGLAAVQRHLANGLPESLNAALRLVVRATIENHLDHPRLHQVLFEEAPRPPRLLRRMRVAEAAIVSTTEQLLADHPEVAVDDTATAARLVVAAIESLVHRLVATTEPVAAERVEHELVAMLSAYLRAC